MFLSAILCLIVLIIGIWLYTDYACKLAVKEYKKKYVVEFNDIQLAKAKNEGDFVLKFKEKLINRFDIDFYDSITKIDGYEKTLIYSIIVANKWDYSEASLNVFMTLARLDKKNSSSSLPEIDFLDEETRKMALNYLQKASDKEHPNAKYILGKYYLEGKYLPKNVTLGNSLLKEAKKLSGGILE